MSRYLDSRTFVYPHLVGEGFPTPPPLGDEFPIDWNCTVIGRFWDTRVFSLSVIQRLVSRFWHLRAPVRVFPYHRDVIFCCGTEQDAEDLEDRAWVHFKGSLMCGFVGHGDRTCVKSDATINYHLENRFRHIHESGGRVLFGPIDTDLYSTAIRGIIPTPSVWTTELWFGFHNEEDPSKFSADSHPSDYDTYGSGLPYPSSASQSGSSGSSHPHRSISSIPGLFPPPTEGVYRCSTDEDLRLDLGVNRAIREQFEVPNHEARRAPRVTHAGREGDGWRYVGS
uniref:Uncharacterized protein n=1 Tax=Chenopodium quinoa TaxID=63459 RepID=A0A803NAM4_CHEQI